MTPILIFPVLGLLPGILCWMGIRDSRAEYEAKTVS